MELGNLKRSTQCSIRRAKTKSFSWITKVGAWGTLAYEKNVLSALLQEHREKDLRHKKDRKVKKKKPRSQSYQNIDGSNEAFLSFSSSRNEWSCLESFWDVSHGILKVHNLGPHLWATPIWATQVRKVYIWAHTLQKGLSCPNHDSAHATSWLLP